MWLIQYAPNGFIDADKIEAVYAERGTVMFDTISGRTYHVTSGVRRQFLKALDARNECTTNVQNLA